MPSEFRFEFDLFDLLRILRDRRDYRAQRGVDNCVFDVAISPEAMAILAKDFGRIDGVGDLSEACAAYLASDRN
jgi:hypothetical protein